MTVRGRKIRCHHEKGGKIRDEYGRKKKREKNMHHALLPPYVLSIDHCKINIGEYDKISFILSESNTLLYFNKISFILSSIIFLFLV